ncbi:lipocalin conserved site [Ceratobasidium sp. AG-Ba]|nr:lipocalin conserved site [Ceratobasidium sp. AG-Ba]
MQFLNSIFAAFAILCNLLPSPPTAGDIVTNDPPMIWQATLSRAVIECSSVAGAAVTAALQVSASGDLIIYTAPVGSFVWRSTSPAVHTWGHHALRSIVRASIDAHDAMYRGRRDWYSGKGATSSCVFTNVRSKLPRPAILGLPAPPRRLTLPAPPRSSVFALPVLAHGLLSTLPAIQLLASLPPAHPLPWLVPDMESSTFPVPVSLASCTPLLTWEAPEDRDNRFLRRARISYSQLDHSITEHQILAAALFVVLLTFLSDLIAFGLEEGYVLYLLNGVGVGRIQRMLEDADDIFESGSCLALYETKPGEVVHEIDVSNLTGLLEDESSASPVDSNGPGGASVADTAPVEMPVDLAEDDATDDASDQIEVPAQPAALDHPGQHIPDSPTNGGRVEPPSSPTVAVNGPYEEEHAADTHPLEPVTPTEDPQEDLLEPRRFAAFEGSPVESSTVVSRGPDILEMMAAARQRQAELEAVLKLTEPAPNVPRRIESPVQPITVEVASRCKSLKKPKKVQPKLVEFRWSEVYMRLDWADPAVEETDIPSVPEPVPVPEPASAPAPLPVPAPVPVPAPAPEPALEPALEPEPEPEPEPVVSDPAVASTSAPAPVLIPVVEPAPSTTSGPEVDQPSVAEEGEAQPKKKRTRGVRGGKSKRRYLQQQRESAGAEPGNPERGPSNSQWFIRQRPPAHQ